MTRKSITNHYLVEITIIIERLLVIVKEKYNI